MKLWIDDVRPAPKDYRWAKSVNKAKSIICKYENENKQIKESFGFEEIPIELIDIDHDAGEYVTEGGDYIKLLDWLEATGRNYPIRIHSMNPTGRINMERICHRNGWTIVK